MVLVDTCVWSLLLRRRTTRRNPVEERALADLKDLVSDGSARLIGVVRQELLSGVKSKTMFAELAEVLCSFPEVPLQQDDFEQAAAFFNQCRAKGVQGSPNDFLLCAVAYRVDEPILTTDKDFEHFAKALPIRLRRPATV